MKAFAAPRVVTCDAGRATNGDPLGVVEDAAVLVEDGRIVAVVPRAKVPPGTTLVEGGLVTPGLVDAHTHAVFTGSRHDEYAVRMAGGDYEAIARAGGGILASHRAVAAITVEELADELTRRLARMAALGVTTCEVKSGYGLTPALEEKQLEAVARAAAHAAAPRVVPTLLALHALPPEARADREGYVRRAAEELVPEVARRGLARFVDAYVDRSAFTVEEARLVATRGKDLGLGVRLHVGQFADVGGAELAAELGARSADHLENVGPAGISALAKAGVRAGLLPIACFTLRQAPPPVEALRAAGVRLVVASDANPGTAPSESLPLALAFAVRLYGLTPEEALLGATREAAASLDVPGGVLAAGAPADLVVWDLPHERALVQPWGTTRALHVVRGGVTIAEAR